MREFFTLLAAVFFAYSAFSQSISGTVLNTQNQPIPYANVYWKKLQKGTLTNIEGSFNLNLSGIKNDTLVAEILGFNPQHIPVGKITENVLLNLTLSASAFELKELIIKPKPASWYVHQAVKSIPQNFGSAPFQNKSYYREVIKENGHFHKYTQAVLESYLPIFSGQQNDTTVIGLLQGKVVDDPNQIQFMKDFVEKKQDKEIKKRVKKNPELKDSLNNASQKGLNLNLGGPIYILNNNLLQGKEFLDSLQFKHYDYFIDGITTYKGRETLIISFDQNDKVREALYSGKIYIDEQTKAITSIQFGMSEKGKKYMIPGYAKAIMWTLGISVGEPSGDLTLNCKFENNKWYFDNFRFTGKLSIEKSYWFKENEMSTFEFEQFIYVLENDLPINREKLLPIKVKKGDFSSQIKETNETFWNNFKVLEPESF